MGRPKAIYLTEAENRLADIIWREAPLTSPELVAIAERELGWKKSTTYTILKRICDKGIFENVNANISAKLTREELNAKQSRRFVEDLFGGSLPRLISAFIGECSLTPDEAKEIQKLIDEHEGGENDG